MGGTKVRVNIMEGPGIEIGTFSLTINPNSQLQGRMTLAGPVNMETMK